MLTRKNYKEYAKSQSKYDKKMIQKIEFKAALITAFIKCFYNLKKKIYFLLDSIFDTI